MNANAALGVLGIFMSTSAMSLDACEALVSVAREADWEEAVVFDGQQSEAVIEHRLRRTRRAEIPLDHRDAVAAALEGLKPALEKHFDVTLTSYERPQLLRYIEGDFFDVHADGSPAPDGYAPARHRKVSLTLYLNDPAGDPGYDGGLLVFYGLMPDPRARRMGFPLVAQTGLLAAFRSDVPHEVTVVTRGERYAIVTWWS